MTNKIKIPKILEKVAKKGVAVLMLSVILSIFFSASTVHAACYANEDVNNVDEIPCPEEPANNPIPQGPLNQLEEILNKQKSGLESYDNRKHELSAVDPGADVITSIIFKAIDLIKYVLGTVAVVYAIISGIKLVTAADKAEETYEKEKTTLKYMLYGLVLVIIADELVTKVFFGEYGECIASASNAKDCAKDGSTLVKGLYSMVLAFMASIAVFVIVLSGYRLIVSAGEEDEIKKQKEHLLYAIFGLVLAGIAEFIVKAIIFPDSGQKGIDVDKAQELVFRLTNFVASFIGAGALLMFLYGGYLYLSSFGNDDGTEKAKKVMIGAIVGIVIAAAAFGIVVTITRFGQTAAQIELAPFGIDQIEQP